MSLNVWQKETWGTGDTWGLRKGSVPVYRILHDEHLSLIPGPLLPLWDGEERGLKDIEVQGVQGGEVILLKVENISYWNN